MNRLWSPGWIIRHVITLVLVVGFLALGWWQVRRAAGGNALSWAYAVEWPVFAGFVVFMWFREVRLTVRRSPDDATADVGAVEAGFRRPVLTGRRAASTAGPPEAGEADGELAAYNAYLTWLNANPQARPGDYPG